jgi:hypothetical protein
VDEPVIIGGQEEEAVAGGDRVRERGKGTEAGGGEEGRVVGWGKGAEEIGR